jgi:cysteine desulfurase
MPANNVLGTIQNLERSEKSVSRKERYFSVMRCKSLGVLEIDVRKMNIDFLSASAHKIGGPKELDLHLSEKSCRLSR